MNEKQKDPTKEERSNLKKLMDSHLTVLEARLGRPPSLQEVQEFLAEGSEKGEEAPAMGQPVQTQPAPNAESTEPVLGTESDQYRPQILDYKIYYGMRGEGDQRKPDKNSILYYESPDGRFYDTSTQEWCDKSPTVAAHLPSRPMEFHDKDIISAIAHGVLGDQDYEALDKASMITELPKQLWNKYKQLQKAMEGLEKSEAVEVEEKLSVPEEMGEGYVAPETTQVTDNIRGMMESAGVEAYQEEFEEELQGENVLQQIVEAVRGSDQIEEKIIEVVHQMLEYYGLISAQPKAPQDEWPVEGEWPENELTQDDVADNIEDV